MIRTTGDCPRSIRNASVIEPAERGIGGAVLEVGDDEAVLFAEPPEATSVPTGPMPSSRIAV